MTALETIARALASLVVSLDQSGEDSIDADFAASLLNDVAADLDALSPHDRVAVTSFITGMAAEERDPVRRRALMELPGGIGLTDEDS
jgi:hypothetical protein